MSEIAGAVAQTSGLVFNLACVLAMGLWLACGGVNVLGLSSASTARPSPGRIS